MNRFGRFWNEFSQSLSSASTGLDLLRWVGMLVVFIAPPALALIIDPNWNIAGWSVFFLPLIVFLAFLGGLAWQKTSGPVVEHGPLTWDYDSTYYIEVRNRSPYPVIPEVIIQDARDSAGNTFSSVKLSHSTTHWRGTTEEEITLPPGGRKQVGVLAVGWEGADKSRLSLFHKHNQVIVLTEYLRDEERQPFVVDLSISCHTQEGIYGQMHTPSFTLTPEPAHLWKVTQNRGSRSS